MRNPDIPELIVDFIHRTVTGRSGIRRVLTPLFGLLFLCIVLLLICGSLYLDLFFGLPEFIPKPFSTVVSLPFLAAGIILWSWCVARFFMTKGTPIPVNPPPVLVTDGPYAFSRNPMMTGLFLVTAGTGIFTGSIILTFITTPLFVLMSILEFRYIEEPELARRFGREYIEYREKTPRIIPRIRRGRRF